MKKILFLLLLSICFSSFAEGEKIYPPAIIKCGNNAANGDQRCYIGAKINGFTIDIRSSSYPYYIMDGIYKPDEYGAIYATGGKDIPKIYAPSVAYLLYRNIYYPQITFYASTDPGYYADLTDKGWVPNTPYNYVCRITEEGQCRLEKH